MTSQNNEKSVEERLTRLERRQDAIAAKVETMEGVLNRTCERTEQILSLLQEFDPRPKINDNHNN